MGADHYRNGYAMSIPFRSFTAMVIPPTIGSMDATTARTENMRRLVADAGGPTGWAKLYGGERWTQAQVSQWISGLKPKPIGGRLARDLESAMRLSHGELDRVSAMRPASQPARLDIKKLAFAIQTIEQAIQMRPVDPPLSAEEKADFVSAVYDWMAQEADNVVSIDVFVQGLLRGKDGGQRQNGVAADSAGGTTRRRRAGT